MFHYCWKCEISLGEIGQDVCVFSHMFFMLMALWHVFNYHVIKSHQTQRINEEAVRWF